MAGTGCPRCGGDTFNIRISLTPSGGVSGGGDTEITCKACGHRLSLEEFKRTQGESKPAEKPAPPPAPAAAGPEPIACPECGHPTKTDVVPGALWCSWCGKEVKPGRAPAGGPKPTAAFPA